jgi:undecaprenyl-diphosphatase
MKPRFELARTVQRLLDGLPNIEPVVLVVLALGIASLWGFIEIAEGVFEGDTQAFDHWMLRVLRNPQNAAEPLGPPWFQEMGRDATAAGGIAWLSFITVVVAAYLWLDRKLHMMAFMLAATIGGVVVSTLLKSLFDRPRPDLVPHLSHAYTSSFPSGHSMLSAIVYLTLGSLLAAVMPSRKLKVYILGVAIVVTVVVGASRVYLGVHYPTDVLAGWLAGLVWALLCWLVARWLQLRGKVEPGSNSSSR